jgi:hypothetical protein
MSSVVKAKCPKCQHEVAVEEAVSTEPVVCEKCQNVFTPATVIAESNRKFEIGMYVVMGLVGLGLIVYMVATGEGLPKPKADAQPAAAEQQEEGE